MAASQSYAREPKNGDIRFDPNDFRPGYIGLNDASGATTTASDWDIFKYTYETTTSNHVTRIQKLTGAWDSRAGLGW